MSSSSSSSTRTATQHQYTPPSESPIYAATPRTASAASNEDLDIHGDAYELQPLKAQDAEEEGGKSRGYDYDDDDDSAGDEVLYAVDEPDSPMMTPTRRRRAQRREFLYTRVEERAVVKKLDRYLVGGLGVLYMLR